MLLYHSFNFFLHSSQYSIWSLQGIHDLIYLVHSLVFKQDLCHLYPVIFSHVFLQSFQQQAKFFRCPSDKNASRLQSFIKGFMPVSFYSFAKTMAISYDLLVSLGWNFGLDELVIFSVFLEQLNKSVFFLL